MYSPLNIDPEDDSHTEDDTNIKDDTKTEDEKHTDKLTSSPVFKLPETQSNGSSEYLEQDKKSTPILDKTIPDISITMLKENIFSYSPYSTILETKYGQINCKNMV